MAEDGPSFVKAVPDNGVRAADARVRGLHPFADGRHLFEVPVDRGQLLLFPCAYPLAVAAFVVIVSWYLPTDRSQPLGD
jgi:hypothetical protein